MNLKTLFISYLLGAASVAMLVGVNQVQETAPTTQPGVILVEVAQGV